APERQAADKIRQQLLSARRDEVSLSNTLGQLKVSHHAGLSEVTWLLGVPATKSTSQPVEQEVKLQPAPPTRQRPADDSIPLQRPLFFAQLPSRLQEILRAQLRQRGDVSAVIETPEAFSIYTVREKTAEFLDAAVISIPKRSYEEW